LAWGGGGSRSDTSPKAKARPPFFVLFGNSVESIPESYKRYLVNGLRETFGLIGVPIRISLRSGGENPYAPKRRRG
jgi:GTP-binding protein